MTTLVREAVRAPNTTTQRFWGTNYRGRMWVLMLLADLTGFATGLGLVLLGNRFLHFMVLDVADLEYLIIPVICLAQFMNSRLYPCVGVSPADEIKFVAQYTSAGFAVGLVFFGLFKPHWQANVAAFAAAWGFSILCVLLARWGTRIVATRLGLWGEPAVVLAVGKRAGEVACYFCKRGRLGFTPALVTPWSAGDRCERCHVPTMNLDDVMGAEDDRFSSQGIQTVMVDFAGATGTLGTTSIKNLQRLFQRVIFVSDSDWLEGASMRIKDFEGVIGVSTQKNALSPVDALLKRGLDILVAMIGAVALLPVWLALAALIALDSPGDVLYSHDRLGKDGLKIKVYKFRTMARGADSVLDNYLKDNPARQLEWEQTQKLRDDPRITRIGRILRKYSLDEFPQLLNVLKGDLSLVGPRPIVETERRHYGDRMEVYASTCPGMTGLWQVSGRNHTSYEERVRYDTYYVRNWSLWLDVYILLRTAWVVLSRDGAY